MLPVGPIGMERIDGIADDAHRAGQVGPRTFSVENGR